MGAEREPLALILSHTKIEYFRNHMPPVAEVVPISTSVDERLAPAVFGKWGEHAYPVAVAAYKMHEHLAVGKGWGTVISDAMRSYRINILKEAEERPVFIVASDVSQVVPQDIPFSIRYRLAHKPTDLIQWQDDIMELSGREVEIAAALVATQYPQVDTAKIVLQLARMKLKNFDRRDIATLIEETPDLVRKAAGGFFFVEEEIAHTFFEREVNVTIFESTADGQTTGPIGTPIVTSTHEKGMREQIVFGLHPESITTVINPGSEPLPLRGVVFQKVESFPLLPSGMEQPHIVLA